MAEYNENQINSNETERISAEQQRIENEAKRQTNETEREAREAIRQSNESTRISEYNTFMADVHNNEDERIANEQARVQAEANRASAEQVRVTRINDIETTVSDVVDTITSVVSDLSSSISEELTNNDVTSFKVGTSNVTGVDLSNQMEQSLVTLNNIEGRSVREDVDDDYVKIINCITLGDLELKSLPNGTKDTYSNGVYTKKINRVYFKDLNWSHYSDGDAGTKTTIYKADIPNMSTCGDASSNNYNFTCSRYDVVSANTQWVSDNECMSMCPSSKAVYLRISKGAVSSSSSINRYLGFHYIDYELESPIEEMRELNFLCNPGDIIGTKNSVPFTCSHTVQLNTKSQVEETQKQIVKSNKSIWQKFKELTDVEVEIGQTGYIKLPTILGGLLIQWGRTNVTFNNEQYKAANVKYSIPFKTDIYFQTCNMFNACTEAYETNTSIVWDSLLQGKICIYNTKGNMSCDVFVYYVAIGK